MVTAANEWCELVKTFLIKCSSYIQILAAPQSSQVAYPLNLKRFELHNNAFFDGIEFKMTFLD